MTKNRVVSGIQPTGKMHLGNYIGSVASWSILQSEFDAFFMIADWHSLTTLYQDPSQLKSNKTELTIDLLACGIDPEKACLFYQSDVPQHAELHLILSMITPLPWLMRVPTYKGKMQELQDQGLDTYGFLGYPVLMAADILVYKSTVIPVGRDQIPHLELAREICRRFNHLYGEVFPEPQERLTETPVLPGTDGRKMSKSYGNTIPLSDSPEELTAKVLKMMTDPHRIKRADPGNPEICPVFSYHKLFNTPERIAEIDQACRSAQIGCVDCKRDCAKAINQLLEPFREKRNYYLAHEKEVADIMHTGAQKAQKIAGQTMTEVRAKIGI